MAPQRTADPELTSFVSTQLLFSRMNDGAATDALEFLATAGPEGSAAPVEEPAELVGV